MKDKPPSKRPASSSQPSIGLSSSISIEGFGETSGIDPSYVALQETENELTTIQLDGQTFIVQQAKNDDDAANVVGDLRDIFLIPEIQETHNVIVNDSAEASQTIWIEGVTDDFSYAMIQWGAKWSSPKICRSQI